MQGQRLFLQRHPPFNSSWRTNRMRQNKQTQNYANLNFLNARMIFLRFDDKQYLLTFIFKRYLLHKLHIISTNLYKELIEFESVLYEWWAIGLFFNTYRMWMRHLFFRTMHPFINFCGEIMPARPGSLKFFVNTNV